MSFPNGLYKTALYEPIMDLTGGVLHGFTRALPGLSTGYGESRLVGSRIGVPRLQIKSPGSWNWKGFRFEDWNLA